MRATRHGDIVIGGLYVIADTEILRDDIFLSAVQQAILGGARLVQYRDKGKDTVGRYRQAIALAALCDKYHVPLMINDHPQLARDVQAQGVHIGAEDGLVTKARAIVGDEVCIGVSCYNDLERAREAYHDGADYLAFGRFFASHTKPHAVQAEPTLLMQARAEFNAPLVAIGGITPRNGTQLLTAGADALAVINGVLGQNDIRAAARAYVDMFSALKRENE